MKVVVLADNQGDSLQPLTSSLSFVKLELLGEPLLFYILDSLLGLPVSEIIIIANSNLNELEILFVNPKEHTKGIGYGAWLEVEALHPETKVWETCTPYFEKRNIHFYVNKCGFQIDQFWCEYFQPEHDMFEDEKHNPDEGPDEMFRFIKVMKP